jgi:hypothetical protein
MPLARVRILIAASILLTAGFAVVIQINEPRAVSVIVTSGVAAVLYALVFAALGEPEAGRALSAAEVLAAVAFTFSAIFGGGFALVGHWLDGATIWLLVVGVVQGLLLRAIRQARPKVEGGRDWRGELLRAFIVGLGILAFLSIFLPDHAHGPRHESATIGEIRTLISAQASYQSANGGFFDTPECLVTPHRCIPAYPANAPTFIDSALGQTTAVRSGYRRVFLPGPPADPGAVLREGASASSLESFAYVAVPLDPKKGGARGLCGDSTGLLCAAPDGRAPEVANGHCAGGCRSVN